MTVATERLWRTVDGDVVTDGDPRAAYLICAPGDDIPEDVELPEVDNVETDEVDDDEPSEPTLTDPETGDEFEVSADDLEEAGD